MTFQEQLNLYMEELSCSGRELAKNSGISETILSRYRKGERIPGADSDYLKKLAAGIALTAEQKGKKIDQERALEALLAALSRKKKQRFFITKSLIFFFGNWKSMYPKWHLPCTMIRPIFPRSEQEKEHPQMSGALQKMYADIL